MARTLRGWPRPDRSDAVGLVLVLALGIWVALVAGDGVGRPGPVLWLLAGLVLTFAAGRALGQRRGVVEGVVVVGIAGAVSLTWPGILRSGGAPTGYANANATLTALGVIAAVAAARASPDGPQRAALGVLAAALALATFLTGSVAGTASLLLALVLIGLSNALRSSGAALVGSIVVVSVALALTTAIALGRDPAGLADRAGLRGELWVAAADVIEEHPLRGIGPGRFEDRNPVSADPDLRRAHHGYLQAGAELGIVGLILVLALGGWLWTSLWRSRADRHAVETGGAALMIVALHGTVDWVWHVPAVLFVLVVLTGAASATESLTGQCSSTPALSAGGNRHGASVRGRLPTK